MTMESVSISRANSLLIPSSPPTSLLLMLFGHSKSKRDILKLIGMTDSKETRTLGLSHHPGASSKEAAPTTMIDAKMVFEHIRT